MVISEEVYLEHFGVKGMKWGVHNKSKKPKAKMFLSTTKEERKANRAAITKADKRALNKDIARLAGGVAVGVGAGIVANKLATKKYGREVGGIAGRVTGYVGASVAISILNKQKKYSDEKSKSITKADIYTARRSLDMKVTAEERKKYEPYYQNMVKEIKANNKAMGKG